MSSNRASLLSGLRTGGVRSASNPSLNGPYTAAIGGQFPERASPYQQVGANYPDESDVFTEFTLQSRNQSSAPATAPFGDASFPSFQQQAMFLQAQAQAQALQRAILAGQGNLQMGIMHDQQQAFQMQELLKLQALQQQQQQQFQAQLIAQAQLQQQMQAQQLPMPRRRPSEPMTAGPLSTSFAIPRPRATSAMLDSESHIPATAALDGRFNGGRSVSGLNPNAASFKFGSQTEPSVAPANSSTSDNWRAGSTAPTTVSGNTTVISGGASLGSATPAIPAKHDTATTWRRQSVPARLRSDPSPPRTSFGMSPSPSPPTVYVSTPEETSPTPSRSVSPPVAKTRPQPLRFSLPVTIVDEEEADPLDSNQVVVMNGDEDGEEGTPTTSSSSHSAAREEASKRLYEGLGIGRPIPTPQVEIRHVSSQPARQPRGPPSGVEDLGTRNFAARIRRKAIGGLGVLMDARGRRESMVEVEAY